MTIKPTLALDINSSPSTLDQFGLWGEATAGATVDIMIDGVTVASVTALANGRYFYQAAQWPSAGHHQIVAQVNVPATPAASTNVLQIDVTGSIPTTPTVSSSYQGIGYLSGPDPFLYGAAEAGSTVRLWSGSDLLATARADATGFWHAQLPGLADGSYHFAVTATTGAGTSALSTLWNVQADWHAPAAPVVALSSGDGGVVTGSVAIFSGTAEPSATVFLSIDGVQQGTTVAYTDGRWTSGVSLAPGEHSATAVAVDGAQNMSPVSAPLAFSMVALPPDIAGDISTTAVLAVGTSAQGTIEARGDHDWFKLTLDALTQVRFTVTGADANGGTLPIGHSGYYEEYLHVWNPQANGGAGDFIGAMPSSAPAGAASWLFSPERAGTYFLDMSAQGISGSYTVSAAVVAHDDYANNTANATTVLPLDGQLTGKIDYAGDVDQFRLVLHAGVTYTLSFDSGVVDYGTVQRSLWLSGGSYAEVSYAANDWTGAGSMSILPSVDGDYFVQMSGGTGDSIPYHLTLVATPDDYLAGPATTGVITLGTAVTGTLEVRADADWFGASLVAGTAYLIQSHVSASEYQSVDVRVFDAQGNVVPFWLDAVTGEDSIVWRPTTSGQYFFQVSGGSTADPYTLLVAPVPIDDFADNAATTGILAPGQSVAGTIEVPLDVDWFKVHLDAGSDYVFNLDGALPGHTLASLGRLRLFDDRGAELANTEFGAAQVVYHANQSGDYFLSADEVWSRHIGSYAVSVFGTSADMLSGDTGTSGTLAPGGLVTGSIDFATDRDWVRVDLKAGQHYDFELTGVGGRGGTLPSYALSLRLLDARGFDVTQSGETNFRDPMISIRPTADVTYYLAISAQQNVTGSYTLKERSDSIAYIDTLPPLLLSTQLPTTVQQHLAGDLMWANFDETVRFGGGAITLALATGAVVETFSSANGNASLREYVQAPLLTPKVPLQLATDYVLTFAPGSIMDDFGHPFPGATVTFRTADVPLRLDGGAGNDIFHAGATYETIDGKAGRDTVVFSGDAWNYLLTKAGGELKVDAMFGPRNHDTLVSIERVVFRDFAFAYDSDGNAGQAYRLYQAALARAPDANGLGYWIAQLDRGIALRDIAHAFMDSAEFTARYGASPSDAQFVIALYDNVLHRAPDQAGADYWAGVLHNGTGREDILGAFSESAENQAALVGQTGTGMVYHPYG